MSQVADSYLSKLIRELDFAKFSELLAASPRQVRDMYFQRHHIKKPKNTGFPKAGAKAAYCSQALYEILQRVDDDELAEQLLRAWLLTKRPLLAAALDHLGIEHVNGLTDSEEVERLKTLSIDELRHLVDAMRPVAIDSDIALYLKFMGQTQVDQCFKQS